MIESWNYVHAKRAQPLLGSEVALRQAMKPLTEFLRQVCLGRAKVTSELYSQVLIEITTPKGRTGTGTWMWRNEGPGARKVSMQAPHWASFGAK